VKPQQEAAAGGGVPLVLETHNYNNVGLYGHFGFALVKTLASPDTEIKQYCTIRMSQSE